MNKILLSVVFVYFLNSSESAKILGIFPTPSISHQVVFHALMKDLAARGHELTILTTDLIKIDNPNVTQIDLSESYKIFREGFNFVDFKNNAGDETDLMNFFFPIMFKYLQYQLDHPDVRRLMTDRESYSFDVVIVEYLMYVPLFAFAELYDAPLIGITSLDTMNENHESIGNEANPVVHPEMLFPFIQGRLTFQERWKCLKNYYKNKFSQGPKFNALMEEFVRKNFPNVTSNLNDLRNRVDFLMTNTHPALGFIRPILPNTIQLGFMHIEPAKELPQGDLKKFLDESKNGVIYMSLGSNVQSKDLGSEIQSIFLNVFRKLKYDVIWKFEDDSLANKPKNVMIQKWLPQADLLAHPNVKLFITQGGQQSMEETIDRGVPTVVIPFLADQDGNAKRMEKLKIGQHLELLELSEEKLKSTIEEVLKPTYKENIRKLRDLVYDEPMTSRERAVWWTEYVIRHKGAKHLAYSGRDVPIYEKYFLDFIAIGLGIFMTAILAVISVLKFLTKTVFADKKNKND